MHLLAREPKEWQTWIRHGPPPRSGAAAWLIEPTCKGCTLIGTAFGSCGSSPAHTEQPHGVCHPDLGSSTPASHTYFKHLKTHFLLRGNLLTTSVVHTISTV